MEGHYAPSQQAHLDIRQAQALQKGGQRLGVGKVLQGVGEVMVGRHIAADEAGQERHQPP
jgi:hypothetical protein